MTSLWFVIPAHGRPALSQVCMRQLRRTCDTLTGNGIRASAVVIADDANLDIARDNGFATIERDNRPLGRKWNDGYELAGRIGVDYVVPFGTDDWIDANTLLDLPLPGENEIRCFRRSAIVSEDGRRLAKLHITYDGGDGVRVIPTGLLEPFGFRPAEEDRKRAIDTSVWNSLRGTGRPSLVYHDLHPLQIVDFKSHGDQLNPYDDCVKGYRDGKEIKQPWRALAEFYPGEAVEEMRAVYGAVPA